MSRYVYIIILIVFSCFYLNTATATSLPNGFVYLSDIDPTIIQEMRYYSDHNFVGRSINGYSDGVCILTEPTAKALKQVQAELTAYGYSLKVYDCYRPEMAVEDFISWSKLSKQQQMKKEFFPRINKKYFFKLGYVSDRSGHTRGSTVDLTIVNLNNLNQASYTPGQKLVACYAPYGKRFHDNSIDMGTGFDCLDKKANLGNKKISRRASQNRQYLQKIMMDNGFKPYPKEWWHFTLVNEPFPKTYFNFTVS